MTTSQCRNPHLVAYFLFAGALLFGKPAFADSESTNCDGGMPATHVELAAGDQNTADHLQLSRKIASRSVIDLDVCAAELSIIGNDSDNLRVTVDIGNPSMRLAADYLQNFDVKSQTVAVRLNLP